MKTPILAALLWLPLLAPAGEKFTRPAMMESMARRCIAPGLAELAAGALRLSDAARELQEQPSTNSLAKTQQAWVQLQLAYKRNQMLRRGPVKDDTFWTLIFFPQALPAAVENVVRSPRPMNAQFIELLGSSAKGFYALEYLLFDAPQGTGALLGKTNGPPRLSAQLLLAGPTAERRRLYVRELTRELEARLHETAAEAQAPDFPAKFAAGGQDSANLLVNQVIDGFESALLQPLNNYTNQLRIGLLRYEMIEGAFSGCSLSGAQSAFEGVRRFYLGAGGLGLDAYIRHVNPDLANRLEALFKSAANALAAINIPLEDALLKNPAAIENAIEEARKLEQICKVDVVAALGVTLLFNSNDGD